MGEFTFSCKDVVLVQAWQAKKDINLISTPHTENVEERESKNEKCGTMKRQEILELMRGVLVFPYPLPPGHFFYCRTSHKPP